MAIVGSGAGGSGAGGSGAGGSGAGGSGAGGSGAGGSGAGGHAGGQSSPLLNTAMTVTSDAITGFWDGTPDRNTMEKPRGHDDLSYLTPSRRMSMFAAESLGRFRVQKASTTEKSKVKLGGRDIHKTRAPSRDFFKEQLKWLRNYADLRVDRIPEINTQIVDLLSFQGMIGQLDAGAHKYTLEALGVVQDVTYSVTMQLKHLVWAPRPIAYSTRVHPIIQTPDHSTFPSAHASEAFAMAVVLEHVLNSNATPAVDPPMSYRVAHRISANRTIAGVHFPVDSAAGAELGIAMGHAMLALMFGEDPVMTEFRAGEGEAHFKKNQDFLLSDLIYQSDKLEAIEKTAPQTLATIYGDQIKAEWGPTQ